MNRKKRLYRFGLPKAFKCNCKKVTKIIRGFLKGVYRTFEYMRIHANTCATYNSEFKTLYKYEIKFRLCYMDQLTKYKVLVSFVILWHL